MWKIIKGVINKEQQTPFQNDLKGVGEKGFA